MKHSTPISSIMTPDPVTLGPMDILDTAHQLFEKNGIHHVPIVQDERLMGMVSHTDYLRVIRDLGKNQGEQYTNQRLLSSITLHEVMSEKLECLHPDDTLGDALRLFKANHFHAIPVVNEAEKLVGIVTTFDMLEVLEVVLSN
jgi:CBS domain-containing membrane protein